jgi:hypothetical protein
MAIKLAHKKSQSGSVITEYMVVTVFLFLLIWLAVPTVTDAIGDREESHTRALAIPL